MLALAQNGEEKRHASSASPTARKGGSQSDGPLCHTKGDAGLRTIPHHVHHLTPFINHPSPESGLTADRQSTHYAPAH